jgi:hypothetical protein
MKPRSQDQGIEEPVAPYSTGAQARADAERRLDALFRLWLRDGHVHPLIHLVRRYRTQGKQ